MQIVLQFSIVIGLMLAAIIFAKSLGAKGAAAAMKGAGALTGAAVGAVGGLTKYGLRKAGAGIGASAGWLEQKAPGGRAIGGASRWLSSKVGTGIKAVEKAAPALGVARKGITEAVKSPLKTTAEGLAAVTKDYGVPGILGRTKDEQREWEKKQKEDKETARKKEIKRAEEDLRAVGRLEKSDQAEDLQKAREDAAKIMDKMKPKEIAGLDKSILKLSSVIDNLTAEDLRAMNREGIDKGVMNEIFAYIGGRQKEGEPGETNYVKGYEAKPNHPAYKYVNGNPTRQIIIQRQQTTTAPKPPTPTASQQTQAPNIIRPEGIKPYGVQKETLEQGEAPAEENN